jgi:DNA helicase II / ATP-dependent DNA helicase PcrA
VVTKTQYSALELCELLGIKHPPTVEQQRVIEAPLEGVYRVIAGAGSGKTETMALRVLYLVANSLVQPQDILGLTFTKKASGELMNRLIERITLLGERLPDIPTPDPFDRPKVHTYNAFATRLFSDYAVYLGVDGDVQVSSAATAWGLARQVVRDSRDTRLADLGVGVDRVASLVLKLSQSLGENEVDAEDVTTLVSRFQGLAELPNGGRGQYAEVDSYVEAVSSLLPLWELVEQFQEAKKRRGIVEFSDQVRFALDVVRQAPQVTETLRHTHKVVLLDEYQDTSVLQAKLLSALFADHPVMAVGDPHQAIYGWRGASAGNLTDFPRQFGQKTETTTFSLSISWRNSKAVLDAANTLAIPLTRDDPDGVVTLQPKPQVPDGAVHVAMLETLEQEADAVAQWFGERIVSGDEKSPTAALLLRNRSHQDVFVRALRAHGITVHVLGIGGLLSDPVVADMVCGVAVVHRPEANTELVRLLAGGKYRVGVADLYALAEVAKRLRRSQSTVPGGTSDRSDDTITPPALSLVEALEWLRTEPDTDDLWGPFSPEGRVRLKKAAELIHSRRRFVHDDLIDQLVGIEKALGLDIERVANPERQDSAKSRAALFDAAATYQATSDHPSVSGFIDWLQEAEWRDNLQPRGDDPEPGCVQVLTIHGAKGLQWDYVAIPRMVTDELPSKSRDGTKGWLQRGELPYPLRGDRNHLPEFVFDGLESRKEVKDAAEEFFKRVSDHHLAEERRLAYVAITRTIREAGLFGSWWATQTRPRPPSLFMRELENAGLIAPVPPSSEFEDNPREQGADDVLWPGDPLGERRTSLEKAASDVLAQVARMPDGIDDSRRGALDDAIAAHNTPARPAAPAIPFRLAASSVGGLLTDPHAVMATRARPTPRQSKGAERAGTLFHEWVETHYRELGVMILGGDVDADSEGEPETVSDLESWREGFLASDFAKRTPVAIEREIHLPIAGRVIVCKVDAVFETDTGVDIVDWKTGRPPANAGEEQARSLQLSLYRLAWSAWTGMPLENITAGWWFSKTRELIRPAHLMSFEQLEAALKKAIGAYEPADTKS